MQTIKDSIGTLVKLQEAETEIVRLESILKDIEKKKNRIVLKEKEFEKALKEKEETLKELASACREYEREIEVISERIKKSNEHLRQVKTNKEYQALRREVDDNKKRKDDLETKLLDTMDKKEEAEQSVDEQRKAFDQIRGMTVKEKEEVDKKSVDEKELLEAYREKRGKIGTDLDPELYTRFKKISKLNDGHAIAQVKNEVCLGCYMNIPPQLYIEVQRGNSVVMCPQCSRILYFSGT